MRNFYKVIAIGLSVLSLHMVEAFDIDTDLKIEAGYRRDNLRWRFNYNETESPSNSGESISGSGSSNEPIVVKPDSSPSASDGQLAKRNAENVVANENVAANEDVVGQSDSQNFDRAIYNFKQQDVWEIGGTATMCLDQCAYVRLKGNYGWVSRGRVNSFFITSTADEAASAPVVANPVAKNAEVVAQSDNSSSVPSVPSISSDSNSENCHFVETTDVVNTIRARNNFRRSNTWNLSIAVGYPMFFNCDQIRIMPLIGYDFDEQQYKTRRCKRPCDTSLAAKDATAVAQPAEGAVNEQVGQSEDSSSSDRRNNFRFRWYGPWVGVNFAYVVDPCWRIISELQYQWLQTTRRVKNHNDFGPTHHHRKHQTGYGVKIGAGVDYRFWCNWHTGLAYFYRYNHSGRHHDRMTWRSSEVTANVGYLF